MRCAAVEDGWREKNCELALVRGALATALSLNRRFAVPGANGTPPRTTDAEPIWLPLKCDTLPKRPAWKSAPRTAVTPFMALAFLYTFPIFPLTIFKFRLI